MFDEGFRRGNLGGSGGVDGGVINSVVTTIGVDFALFNGILAAFLSGCSRFGGSGGKVEGS